MKYPMPLVWLKEVCIEIGGWIECWFEDHKLVRRILVLWAIWLITSIAFDLLIMNPEKVSEPVAKVAIACVGLLSIVLTFYQWSRGKEGSDGE